MPMADNSMTTKPPETSTRTSIDIKPPETSRIDECIQDEAILDHESSPQASQRDVGVPDHVWAQLLRDKEATDILAAENEIQLSALSEATHSIEVTASNTAIELARLEAQAKEKSANDEIKRRHEQMRLQHLKFLAVKRDAEDKLRRAQAEAEAARKQEVRAQEKLRLMGICPAGFRWIKQSGGYRCTAGGHFVGNAELGFD